MDEKALVRALREERIWGLVLDAVEKEPPTLETYEELLESERVILTPHVGASTIKNQSRSGVVVETLFAVLRGSKDVQGNLV